MGHSTTLQPVYHNQQNRVANNVIRLFLFELEIFFSAKHIEARAIHWVSSCVSAHLVTMNPHSLEQESLLPT